MRKIKDFFYNFQDMIIVLALLALIAYVLFTNVNYLVNLENPKLQTSTKNDDQVGPKETTTEVIIPKDIDKKQLADVLKGYGAIESTDSFIKRFDEVNKDAKIKSGIVNIKSTMTMDEIIKEVTSK